MIFITLYDGVKMLDGFSKPAVRAADAAKLIVRIDFARINLDGAQESGARFIQLPALLIDQAEVVMSRGVGRIEGGDFKMLLEIFAGALPTDQVAKEISEQQDE